MALDIHCVSEEYAAKVRKDRRHNSIRRARFIVGCRANTLTFLKYYRLHTPKKEHERRQNVHQEKINRQCGEIRNYVRGRVFLLGSRC